LLILRTPQSYGWGHSRGPERFAHAGVVGPLPFGKAFHVAVSGDIAVFGAGKPFEAGVLDSRGSIVRWLRVDGPLEPVRERDIGQMKARVLAAYVPEQRARAEARLAAIPEYPVSKPAYRGLIVDDEGFVWALAWEDPPRAWVLDQGGRLLGQVALPAGLRRIWQIGKDYVLATRRDALDVDEVVVFRLMGR